MANKKEYILQNQKFLRDIAADPQTLTLPKGILYQVIKSGEGASPSLSSVVCVYYTGALINGKVFDNNTNQSYPDALRLSELITGWQIALTRMHVGDKWRIYIPAEMGYGAQAVDGIPKNSTLIFEIELVSVA